MNKFSFAIPGKPIGKARARTVRNNGVTRSYTPEKTAAYERHVQYSYKAANGPHYGKAPIALEVFAFFEVPKSASKAKRKAMLDDAIKPTIKPDADNVCKIISDALTGVAYNDDAQVVSASVVKMYSAMPCVCVHIGEAVYDKVQGF